MKKLICTICARSGSKGILDKNIKELAGIPLLGHTVKSACDSGIFDEIVMTSDSQKYLDFAVKYGDIKTVLRPESLAKDSVTKLASIEHAVESVEKKVGYEFEVIVDLDVTSPLRNIEDIKGALNLFLRTESASVITASSARRSPYTNLVEVDEDNVVRPSKSSGKILSRRQESPSCFDMNAAVYVWDRNIFKKNPLVFYDNTRLYEMPFERSWDIDESIDFEIVEFLLLRNQLHTG